MCVLKNFFKYEMLSKHIRNSSEGSEPDGNSANSFNEKKLEDKNFLKTQCFICPCQERCMMGVWNPLQIQLMKLFLQLNQTNNIINNLNEKLISVEETVTSTIFKLSERMKDKSISSSESGKQTQLVNEKTVHFFNLLFPNLYRKEPHQQKYRLTGFLPTKLYKERNFQIKVKLLNQDNSKQLVKNGNILHACIGVFDNQGNWVTQNKSGQGILKGKTEVQLYNGEAIFEKIHFSQGKLNIVIYVKPSAIEYKHMEAVSEDVEWDNICPLFANGVKILSRKKTNYDNWTR